MPYQMKPLLDVLAKNRRLTNLNLAWNNIMDLGEKRGRVNEKIDEEEIQELLGKLIKHSKTLQHLNLTGTGLTS